MILMSKPRFNDESVLNERFSVVPLWLPIDLAAIIARVVLRAFAARRPLEVSDSSVLFVTNGRQLPWSDR